MNEWYVERFAELYSIKRFAQGIKALCLRGEAVLVLIPVWLGEPDAWNVIRSAFEQDDLPILEVKATAASDPVRLLYQEIFDREPAATDDPLDTIVEQPWPGDVRVILLKGVTALPAANANVWYETAHNLTRRLVERQQHAGRARSIVMFNFLDANNPSPPIADPPFNVAWWFGIPSMLDFRSLCRQVVDIHPRLDIVTKRWLEAIIPVLAGGDYTQIDRIITDVESGEDGLDIYLGWVARQHGWSAESLLADGAAEFFSTPANFAWDPLPDQAPPNIKLWAKDALYATPEEGVRLHPAAVRLLGAKFLSIDKEGRNFRFNHMIWQAQNSLCYGLLNEARLILNEAIEEIEGKGWALRVPPSTIPERQELANSSLCCEIGHLRQLIDQAMLQLCQAQLKEPVKQLNEVRKALAHYRPLPLAELRRFAAMLQELPLQVAASRVQARAREEAGKSGSTT